MPPAARPIVFVSDFGLGNEWVGICHSVLAGISPRSPIVDLTHLIPPSRFSQEGSCSPTRCLTSPRTR
jgi:S-adenosylmethionine hydrolase